MYLIVILLTEIKLSWKINGNYNFFFMKKTHLIIDEPSQSLDLQHVGLMGSKLVDETVCCFIVSVQGKKQI